MPSRRASRMVCIAVAGGVIGCYIYQQPSRGPGGVGGQAGSPADPGPTAYAPATPVPPAPVPAAPVPATPQVVGPTLARPPVVMVPMPPPILDRSTVIMECGSVGPEAAAPPSTEQGVLISEQLPVRCEWGGVEVPVYRQEDSAALLYRPVFKPVELRANTLLDPSGRTLELTLRPTAPPLSEICQASSAVTAQELANALPLPLDAVVITLERPVPSSGCTLRFPGAQHSFSGAEETVRIRFPSRQSAQAVLAEVEGNDQRLAIDVRYAVHGRNRAPTCQIALERFSQIDVRSLVERGRQADDALLNVTEVYLTSRALRDLRSALKTELLATISSYGGRECPASIVDTFLDDMFDQWSEEVVDPVTYRSALDIALGAFGPDGDEEALESCRRQAQQQVSVEAGLSVGPAHAGGSYGSDQRASGTPCLGELSLHRVALAALDEGTFRRLIEFEYADIGVAAEFVVQGLVCEATCGGCCTPTDTCLEAGAGGGQTTGNCGTGVAGGSCVPCSQGWSCSAEGAGACQAPDLEGTRFRVTLVEASAWGCDVSATCEMRISGSPTSVSEWYSLGSSNGATTVRLDRLLWEETGSAAAQAWDFKIIDADVMSDDTVGRCQYVVAPDLLQSILVDADQSIVVEQACPPSSKLTFRLDAVAPLQ